MKYKIGVYGSASGEMERAVPMAREVGRELGRRAADVIVITGACPGLPHIAAQEAATAGAEIWGYPSTADAVSMRAGLPDHDQTLYNQLEYVPAEYQFLADGRVCKKYRNVTSTASCDAGLLISGRWGTLNEFTNLMDMGKVVGVLTGTGGVADELERLTQVISKEGQGNIIFQSEPRALLTSMLKAIDSQRE